jgi:PadR family transcriptional regulator AphA
MMEVAMNTLSYGLLALLSKGPRSGYDLMLQIQPLWQAKHSQIYPLLAQLVKKEYVQFVVFPQTDKPDKKVYSITDRGINTVKEWIVEPTAKPVVRDELLLKIFCVDLVDREQALQMCLSRKEIDQEKLVKSGSRLSQMIAESPDLHECLDINSPKFGQYILLQKAVYSAKVNVAWCDWVVSLLNKITPPESEQSSDA